MKLIRYGDPGRERPGVQLPDGTCVDAESVTRDYDEAFFAADGLDALTAWIATGAAAAARVPDGARLGSPVARPSKIVCIGLNYSDHAAETGAEAPREPVLFFKATTALCGPNDDLVMPRGATKVDWEVELAVIIGRTTRYVAPTAAMACVAGYALHNDYSER